MQRFEYGILLDDWRSAGGNSMACLGKKYFARGAAC